MSEKIAQWVARRLPKQVVQWCAFRVGAHATTGKWGNQIVSELTFMDAMKRWEEK